jgi:hypothetical protein
VCLGLTCLEKVELGFCVSSTDKIYIAFARSGAKRGAAVGIQRDVAAADVNVAGAVDIDVTKIN